MNSKSMIQMVGVKCDDIDPGTFPVPLRYDMLNHAVNRIIDMLENYYLQELIVVAKDKELDDDGAYDLSSLSQRPYSMSNGVIKVRMLMAQPRYLPKLSFMEYSRVADEGITNLDEYYYALGTKIYCNPTNYNIDIVYLRKPATISEDQDCDLDERYHYEIVNLACAMLTGDTKKEYEVLQEVKEITMRSRATDSNRLDDEDNVKTMFPPRRTTMLVKE